MEKRERDRERERVILFKTALIHTKLTPVRTGWGCQSMSVCAGVWSMIRTISVVVVSMFSTHSLIMFADKGMSH